VDTEYFVDTITQTEFLEQKSRFISRLVPCASVADFKTLRDATRHEFSDATHVAYAYRIHESNGLVVRFSDDGEVPGTAGRPILNHLEGRHLINVALLVIRYFGGIKLGVGGLGRAYGAAAKSVLTASTIKEVRPFEEWTCVVPYAHKSQFEYVAKHHEVEILSCEFAAEVTYRVRVFETQKLALTAAWRGLASIVM
jgi:uncharacterized YigZ family protein